MTCLTERARVVNERTDYGEEEQERSLQQLIRDSA